MYKTFSKNKVLKRHAHFDTIDSTSTFLKTSDIKNGDVASSVIQTGGQGKQGAKWISKKGGLWFSFAIKKAIKDPYMYVIISSVAVTEVLKMYGLNTTIKWPNDILVNGKKICGIIIDNNIYDKKLIVGIGININNPVPAGTQTTSTTMKKELHDMFDISHVFNKVIAKLDKYILNMKVDRVKLVSKWISMQVDLTGKEIKLAKTGKKYKVIAVNKNGTIKVKDKKGKLSQLKGDIFFV